MARKAKTMTTEIIAAGMTAEALEVYASWGYDAPTAERLEATAAAVADGRRQSVQGLISAATALWTERKRTPHGQWGEYIRERLQMSDDTAERLLAVAATVEKYPQMIEYAANFTTTGLYALTKGKFSNDKTIMAVLEDAANGVEVNEAAVRDTYEIVNPAESTEKPAPKLPFKPLPQFLAAAEVEKLHGLMAKVIKMGEALDLPYDKILKSKGFKDYLKDGKPVVYLAAYAYYLDVSADQPAPALDDDEAEA